MSGDYARDYFTQRARRMLERHAVRQEWDYLARMQTKAMICDAISSSWRPIVCQLHRRLLTINPEYRLYGVREVDGGLVYDALFTQPDSSRLCRRLYTIARAEAARTCQVCGADARLRHERPRLKTLCDACLAADRVAARDRGERYARLVLDYLMSGDPQHPEPEETLAWLAADDS
jgi:hypothetical protein